MDGDAGRRRGPAARSPTGRADRSCASGASPPTTGFRGHTVTEPSPGEAEASLEKLTAPRDGLVPVIDRIQTLRAWRSEEHTSELQSRGHLVCRLLLEKKN